MAKQHLDAAERPYIDIELQFDPLQADPLLQKSLVPDNSDNNNTTDDLLFDTDTYGTRNSSMMAMTTSNRLNHHKRKLSLDSEISDSEESESTDATSDTSGRFDDADEESDVQQQQQSPVTEMKVKTKTEADDAAEQQVHSAKRGRSNGWPLQNEIAYDENGMTIDLSARRSTRTPTPTPTKTKAKTKGANSASPRARSAAAAAVPVLRTRRSRFIEGSMNDRVSEKPPSIFFRDDHMQNQNMSPAAAAAGEKKTLEKRSSGIFRFGKAIASAFHPFGSRGANKSEHDIIGGAKSQKEIMKQRQIRAEQAYAELKKSSYKGTGTASFNANANANVNYNYNSNNNKVDAGVADETWKAIQEKMSYKVANESRISQDDTLVAAPGAREEAPTPLCAEKGVSKLKSFSELRKRTSNLGIPAIRFRDVSPMSIPPSDREDEHNHNHNSHRAMERRQSRKELNRQAKLLKRVSNLEDKLLRARRELQELADLGDEYHSQHLPTVPTICVDDEHSRPGAALPTIPSERLLDDRHAHIPSETDTVKRGGASQKKAIWPPVDSLSRKRRSPIVAVAADEAETEHHNVDDDMDCEVYDADCGKAYDDDDHDNDNSPRSTAATKRVRNKHRSTRDKRASSLTTKASQRLKAKQSSRNLRQVVNKPAIKNNSDSITTSNHHHHHLQEQEGNNNAASSTPITTSATKKKRGRTYYSDGGGGDDDDENIPPVPPVPRELLLAGGDARGTKIATKGVKARVPSKELSWPEDIF